MTFDPVGVLACGQKPTVRRRDVADSGRSGVSEVGYVRVLADGAPVRTVLLEHPCEPVAAYWEQKLLPKMLSIS